MPRPAPYRLDLASYPVRETVPTRYQDLDAMGHINNVAFAALFETARVRFNWVLGRFNRDDGFRAVVAMNAVNYLAEGSFPADVEIATGIGRIGTRSWEIHAVMHQNGRAIATCDTVLVMTDPKEGAIPDDFRAALQSQLMLASHEPAG
ncbi:thioesterase family protein [uncultured Sphingomonas sp.]|uniref:acyl-CoA thioesterase n=1 Tax=uncultured Sphingomonas sp. TaxID=158754 RepID=UPI002624A2F7|nr:thioesterase family protein [uncultured Sphingomonas sp.]